MRGWSNWQSDLYGQVGRPEQQAELDVRFWWRMFNDPVLNELVETARRENPTLRIAGLRILESRAVLGIASSNRYPQLQQASGAVNYVDSRDRGGQAGDRDQSFTTYRAGVDVGWSSISGDDSGAVSNLPKPGSSPPSPLNRTCRYC